MRSAAADVSPSRSRARPARSNRPTDARPSRRSRAGSAPSSRSAVRCILSAGGDGSGGRAAERARRGRFRRAILSARWRPPARHRQRVGSRARRAKARHAACARSPRHDGPMPTRRYALFNCDGMLTFFARLRLGRAGPRRLPAAGRSDCRRTVSPRACGGTITAMLTRHRAEDAAPRERPTSSSRTSATR